MPIRKRYQHEHVEGARVGRFNMGINTTFIVYRMGQTLIDTGPPNQWRAVKKFIEEKPVSQLLLSHHHEDHSGNAQRIAELYNLTPLAPELGQEKLAKAYKTPLLQQIVWGRPLPVDTDTLPNHVELHDGNRLQAIHTPGHAKDLHCFYMPDQGWLFSGDLYISKSLKYLRSDEDLQQLVDSIRKVLKLDFSTLFCPHRGILEDGYSALQTKLDNIISLCQQAQLLHSQGVEFSQILAQTLGPEDMMNTITKGNFCKTNLVKQALTVC